MSTFPLTFSARAGQTLASMSEIDPRADTALVNWSDLGVSGLLPTGTVTLVLADVEGSTRLWQTQPEEMTAAVARLNRVFGSAATFPEWGRAVDRPPPCRDRMTVSASGEVHV
jgi:class 3 adenylate cyclase